MRDALDGDGARMCESATTLTDGKHDSRIGN